jgi:hypothetical protein
MSAADMKAIPVAAFGGAGLAPARHRVTRIA